MLEMVDTALPSHVSDIESKLVCMDRFLYQYEWLVNSYTTDYFTKQLEEKFPPAFRDALINTCGFQDLAEFLPSWSNSESEKQNNARCNVLPLSMLAFNTLCKKLSLNQEAVRLTKMDSVFGSDQGKYYKVCMKQKKQHEVDILSDLISSLCKQTGCNHVVDVGAGLGHLSRLLAYSKNIRVTTIEATDSHSPKADRLDKQTANLLSKGTDRSNESSAQAMNKPNHLSHWINSDISTQEFVNLLNTERKNYKPETAAEIVDDLSGKMGDLLKVVQSASQHTSGRAHDDDVLPWFDLPWSCSPLTSIGPAACLVLPHNACPGRLLTTNTGRRVTRTHRHASSVLNRNDNMCLSGLHACGDLSPTLLRVFVNLECAELLSSVACCYMKMECSRNPQTRGLSGFPMSEYVKQLPYHKHLKTYEALELACHFVSQYKQKLLSEDSSLKRHAVRAALQVLIDRRIPKEKQYLKRLKIKESENMPFKEYTKKAFKKLNIDFDVGDEEIMEVESMIEREWRAVVGAYAIRLALAPVMEAYILLDRMMYLYEQGICSRLIPIFDPSISPRNLALIASKKCQLQVTYAS